MARLLTIIIMGAAGTTFGMVSVFIISVAVATSAGEAEGKQLLRAMINFGMLAGCFFGIICAAVGRLTIKTEKYLDRCSLHTRG